MLPGMENRERGNKRQVKGKKRGNLRRHINIFLLNFLIPPDLCAPYKKSVSVKAFGRELNKNSNWWTSLGQVSLA